MVRITSMAMGEQSADVADSVIVNDCYSAISEGERSKLIKQKENHAATLRKVVKNGERSGESKLSLREIADRKKQEHRI